jgi:hypothetical protein
MINKGSDDAVSIAIYKALTGECTVEGRYCIRFLHANQKIAESNCTIKEVALIILFYLKGNGKIDITLENTDSEQPCEFVFAWG